MSTGFYWDERCFWHYGGDYMLTAPVGGFVQPPSGIGLPENPETKRRLKNLLDVSGLISDMAQSSAPAATSADLRRIHPDSYLQEFKRLSDDDGGELGERTPFGKGGFECAALSAGLAKAALFSVLKGQHRNAYALCRPPGHHCLPDRPMGYCLMANIPIALEAARAAGLTSRAAVVDWDVHHGNGTEAIYSQDSDILTISLHQEGNYPWTTGQIDTQAEANINIPLPPGAGHHTYLEAMDRIVIPALHRHAPDCIIIACGYDASGVDPLSRMLCGSQTFATLTENVLEAAASLCNSRLMMAHEGGYSELHVPFCGHAVLSKMSGRAVTVPDPLAARIAAHQPNVTMQKHYSDWIGQLANHFEL